MKSKFIYSLPFNKKVTYLAVSDPNEHSGRIKNAVDFLMDFDQEILAPLEGQIWNVKSFE